MPVRPIDRGPRSWNKGLLVCHRRDGEHVHLVAHDQFSPESVAAVRKAYPAPLTSNNPISVAIRERRVVHEPDVLVSGGYSELQRTSGYRSILIVPMLRDEAAIAVMRLEPQLFPKAQVDALRQRVRLIRHPRSCRWWGAPPAAIPGPMSAGRLDWVPSSA